MCERGMFLPCHVILCKVHMCERGMFLYHVTSFSVKSICVKEECFYHVTSFSVKSICVKEECFYPVTSFSVKSIFAPQSVHAYTSLNMLTYTSIFIPIYLKLYFVYQKTIIYKNQSYYAITYLAR